MATVAAYTFAAANASVRIPKPFSLEKKLGQALVISSRRLSATAASGIYASMSMSLAATPLSTKPDELVESILSQVVQTDRGVILSRNEHQGVAEVAIAKILAQIVFEPPELNVGGWEFKYGGKSEVKLQITHIDDKIRLGKGLRGSLFVFQIREPLP